MGPVPRPHRWGRGAAKDGTSPPNASRGPKTHHSLVLSPPLGLTNAVLSMVLPARPDRASLSGMFGCLWHDVETGWSSQKDRAAIQEACASALAEWVRDFMVTRRPALTEQCNAAWEAAGAEGTFATWAPPHRGAAEKINNRWSRSDHDDLRI